jgi:dipeptidyl aminopeptidase/acylaminoacyl peptidase
MAYSDVRKAKMKQTSLLVLLAAVGAALSVHAAAPKAAAVLAEPPLIDRNLFFGEVAISGAQISPDGKFLSFLKPYKGTRNIWVKGADEPFSTARPLSAETTRPIRQYFWSRDSKFVLYAQDAGGDENFNVYAIDPSAPADAASGVPPTRALTNLKGVRTQIFASPKAKPDVLYIGLNDRDPKWHDLYELHISSGEKTLLRTNTEQVAIWQFDDAGALRAATRTNAAGDTEILRVDADGLKKIYGCNVFESCGVYGFDGSNQHLYVGTNAGSLDLVEMVLVDLASGSVAPVARDPMKRADLSGDAISSVDHRIIFLDYTDDHVRRYFKDRVFEQDYHWLQTKLPRLDIDFGASSADENIWIVVAHSDTEPGIVSLWNRHAKTLLKQYTIREEIPRVALSSRKPFHYKSSDGLDIPAYLTLPKGLAAKNLPLIVYPHGGPWGRDNPGYDTSAQFFSNRGYAVLQPNFRASTGYGKAFLNAGNGQWGRKMQDDLTWGVKALVAQGLVDAKRVGISGGSYGGYATLAGVAFTPKLYAAAVAVVAPSNLITLLDAIPPYWEAQRKQLYARMGDPGTAEGKALLIAESPLTQAKAIVTPLMVVQGKNDPRVNIRESNQIVVAVRDNGKPVKYLVAPDEGHGFARPINNLASITATEEFFSQYLDGRYQKEVPPDVAAKLAEITVDPATVSGDITLKSDAARAATP